jgi:tetratricopeptide (TPR) repeat protein
MTNAVQSALARMQKGDLAGAERLLHKALQRDPGHPEVLLLMGDLRLRGGDAAGAETCFHQVLRANAGHLGARMALGAALQAQGRTDDAVREFTRVSQANPALAEPHLRIGVIAARGGRLREAERHLVKAVACEPDNPNAHLQMGLLYASRAWWAAAEKEHAAAARLAPRWGLARYHHGTALFRLERFEEAVAELERALELDPAFPDTRVQLGLAWQMWAKSLPEGPERADRFERAIEVLGRALELAPGNAAAHERLGSVLYGLQRYDEAAESFARALAIEPARPVANFNYGLALRKVGDAPRQALLARLAEPHRYADPAEAAAVAVELARTCPYPDAQLKERTVAFLEAFAPGELFPARWWEERLGALGPREAAPDKLLRSVFSLVYAWSMPAREALEAVAAFAEGRRVSSYGAGNAYWEFLLATHFDLSVAASDIEVGHRFLEVARADLGAARAEAGDMIFFGWILNEEAVVAAVVRLLETTAAGQRVVIVGEPPDAFGVPRSCGSPRLFTFLREQFELVDTVPLPRFAFLNDVVSLYRRR